MSPGQNYNSTQEAIKSLGQWHQFQYSLFYVNTALTAQEAYAVVMQSMDTNDRLAVINASGGMVSTWDKPPIDAINAIWAKA